MRLDRYCTGGALRSHRRRHRVFPGESVRGPAAFAPAAAFALALPFVFSRMKVTRPRMEGTVAKVKALRTLMDLGR